MRKFKVLTPIRGEVAIRRNGKIARFNPETLSWFRGDYLRKFRLVS